MKFEDHLINTKNIHFPHRHDFYYLLYITSGGGSHTIDFKTYPIKQNQLFFMSPGQVHEWDIKPNTKGFTLFFNKELLKTNVFKIEEEWSFFHTFFNDCSYVIPKDHQPIIHNLFTLILTENAKFSIQQQQIAKALTSVLLFKINSILNNTNNILPSSLHFQIRKFELLIDTNFNSQHSVLYYANKLNITPNYLNSLCKKNCCKIS